MSVLDVLVIGGGPAGMMAATVAAERDRRTLLLEKNRKLGVKILMSGGTRCNLTQHCDARGIIDAFGAPGRFLHSALAAFDPPALVDWVEAEGVPTKIEPGGKIFPVSDRAADVQQALANRLHRSGAAVRTSQPVLEVGFQDGLFRVTTDDASYSAPRLVLTTGGQSYPGCGTTGDGYRWAAELGHTIVPPRPALVPITSPAEWVRQLQGVTVPDVQLRLRDAQGKVLDQRRGSFLFTHFGVSGPVSLDISRLIARHERPAALSLHCDFLPGQTTDQCRTLWNQSRQRDGRRTLAAGLAEQLPRRLVETLWRQANVSIERRAAEVSKAEMERLLQALKASPIPLEGTRGFAKAEVTSGGIALDEVDSSTLQSKRTAGLSVAGEVLDLDGPIGGYNFQAAFSTGYLAGLNA